MEQKVTPHERRGNRSEKNQRERNKKELRKSVKTKKNTQIGNMFDELNTKE